MSDRYDNLNTKELHSSYDNLPYSFCIIHVDPDSPNGRWCTLDYANRAVMQLFNMDFPALKNKAEAFSLTQGKNSEVYQICYSTAIEGATGEHEFYLPSLKKYIQFSTYQYSPGYIGLLFKDVTSSRLYSAALKSMILAYLEIYYIRINEDYYQMIYPDINSPSERGSYTRFIDTRLRNGIICSEDEENVKAFLSIDNIKASLASNDYIEYKYQRNHDGSDHEWCLTSFAIVERSNGIPVSATMTIRSIDNIVRQEMNQQRLLEEAAEEAHRANAAKTDFFSTMSHDMRTPLNVIIGMSYLAQLHCDDKDRVSDCLEKINTSSTHLLTLINEVLDMAKIESGHIDLNNQAFSLAEMMNEVVLMSQNTISTKHQHLLFNQHNPEHEYIIGDKNRLIQILLNLTSNAIKYTPDGGEIIVDIDELPCDREGFGLFQFIVKDNGIGMSPEFIGRIFEPFEREKDARVDTVVGTGLGMTITKRILDMMEGRITVESKEGEGSVFTVQIPLRLQDVDTDKETFPNEKILVIDDYESCRYSICNMLEAMEIRSAGARSGKEGVNMLLEASRAGDPFTCVILDYVMPDEDGITTTEIIRTIFGRELPIVLLSAYDYSNIQEDAVAAGVDMFFTKPVFRSNIVTALHEIANRPSNDGIRSSAKSYHGLSALLVEDNSVNADIAAELLEYLGLNITIAYDGQDALKKFCESDEGYYGCIFMDIQMPVLNGLEATRQIRALNRSDSDVPIFAMTANVFTDDVRAALDAGMQGHISKPIELDKVEKLLEKWFT